ncbi:MAG: D-aminoacylase [Candidatus Pacebacteria bacterium]|nr:D-aminoacylase [Candidatus Paceibacterota bacterium]
MFDLVIKNGVVIDGSGFGRVEADVAIENNRIVAIEKLHGTFQAKKVIDAKGKIVCPGFIDILDHSDSFWTLFTIPRLDSKITQGITTIIGGNCGSSLAPVFGDSSIHSIRKWVNLDNVNVNWSRMSEFFGELNRRKIGINFGTLVGHETLRRGMLGDDVRKIREDEVKMIGKMLYDSLKEGAFGMSTGLVFSHERMVSPDEIKYLAEILKSADALYASHVRGEAEELLPSVNEAIQVGRETGVSIEISHFKAIGKKYWSDMERALKMIDIANEEGVNMDFDIYPYDTTGSVLYILLPDWVAEGGRKKMISRLKDLELRQKIIREMKGMDYDYENIIISICPKIREIVGKRIIDMARGQEICPEEAIIELLISSNGHVIVFDKGVLSEKNIEMEIKSNNCLISSADAAYNTEYARSGELVHPRCFGSFVRVLGKYSREKQIISLEKAINKMTLMPAQKIGIKERGLLQTGYFADIVVFNPETVGDRSDFENPYKYSTGVDYVFVNGKLVIDNGQHTGELAGRVLKK